MRAPESAENYVALSVNDTNKYFVFGKIEDGKLLLAVNGETEDMRSFRCDSSGVIDADKYASASSTLIANIVNHYIEKGAINVDQTISWVQAYSIGDSVANWNKTDILTW